MTEKQVARATDDNSFHDEASWHALAKIKSWNRAPRWQGWAKPSGYSSVIFYLVEPTSQDLPLNSSVVISGDCF